MGSPPMTDYKSSKAGSGRKKGRGRTPARLPLPAPLELWEAAGLEKAEGGRVVVTAYCLSSVHCGSSLGVHSARLGYLYPLNIHASGGRLPPFSSTHTLWRHCIQECACCERALLTLLFLQDFPVYIWTMLGTVPKREP